MFAESKVASRNVILENWPSLWPLKLERLGYVCSESSLLLSTHVLRLETCLGSSYSEDMFHDSKALFEQEC